MNLLRLFHRWFREPELSRVQIMAAIWSLPDPIRPGDPKKVTYLNLVVRRDERVRRIA